MKTLKNIVGRPLKLKDGPAVVDMLRDRAVDDSLILSCSTKGKLKGTDKAAVSPSMAKRFAEDPQLFYIKKVARKDEPMALPLIYGIGGHLGLEVFLEKWAEEGFRPAARQGMRAAADEIEKLWPQVEDRTIKENVYDLANPRGRREITLSRADLEERVTDTLWRAFCLLDEETAEAGGFSLYEAQREVDRVEASVGELAKENGLPSHTITSYDGQKGKYGPMAVALIGGVPVRGRIDLLARLPDGSEVIIDHKFVTKVVSFYPPYQGSGPWKRYSPSYNVADSYQLDLYSTGGGVYQAGFQFVLRRPQYIPPSGELDPQWVDYRNYDGDANRYPMHLDKSEEGGWHLGIYRARPQTDAIERRAYLKTRSYAQAITESMILHDNGVDPEIAFPSGDPEEIGRKACPYCHFGPSGTGFCNEPRDVTATDQRKLEAAFQEALRAREEICAETPAIVERRERWHRTYGVRSWLTP